MAADELKVGMATDYVEQQLAGLYAFGNHLSEISTSINSAVAHDWEPNLENIGSDVLKAATLVVRGGPVGGSISYLTYLANKRGAAEMAMNAAQDISTASTRVFELTNLLRENMRDQVSTSSDKEGYAEPAMSAAQAKGIYDKALKNPSALANMTPLQVSAWWRRLSPAQQEEFLRRQPGATGNTNGIPFDVRMQANVANAQEYLREHPELLTSNDKEDKRQVAYLQSVTAEFVDVDPHDGINDHGAVRLIAFDPGKDRIIEVIGDLNADTTNIINYVPGTGADIKGFYAETQNTQMMAQALVEGHPGRVAFVWKDAEFPTFNPGATAVSGNVWAANVGSRYAEFNSALAIENGGHIPVMSIEHSFGSAVGGYAETSGSHFATRVVLGGAGMTEDWRPQEGTTYIALVDDRDIIRNIQGRYVSEFDMGYAVAPDAAHGWREVDPDVVRQAYSGDLPKDVIEDAIYQHRDVADPTRSTNVMPTIEGQLNEDARRTQR